MMKLKKDKIDIDFAIGAILISILLVLSVIGLLHTPFDPYAMNAAKRFLPASSVHLLGTDNFGRDNLSRIIVGIRYTLFVAFSTVLISGTCGIAIGLWAGYVGGAVEEIIMRVIDAVNSFPTILLALVMVTVLRQGKYTIIVALSIVFVPSFTRIARSETKRLKERDFIKLAKTFGTPPVRIMFVHILPNMLPSLLSAVVVGFSNAVLAESGMSYLGLGIQPPAPSLGRMLFEAQSYLFYAPLSALAPGIMIVIAVMGFNFLGEGIRKEYC